jgi:hypothetical protein
MRETVSHSKADRNQSLLGGNKLKLAVFGANVSGGCAMTSAAGTIKVDWAESKRIAQAARCDRAAETLELTQLSEQRLSFLKVRRSQPLGKPTVDFCEYPASFIVLALFLPQASQAHHHP